jgi:hypothetical protein
MIQPIEPDLRLEGFRLWIHGLERPDASDYWDGNWLQVTASVEAAGSWVEASGTFLRTDELAAFAGQMAAVDATLAGKAELTCMEPQLRILLEGNGLGHIAVTIDLTPDYVNQSHRFRFDTDQTWLRPLLNALEAILDKHPVRGLPSD